MFKPLALLAPALIPSWNFFDVIAPSPRLEYALGASAGGKPGPWLAFRPLPRRVSPLAMLGRLVWNPRWNETLFLVSCAERMIQQPTAHSEDEIFRRLAADLARQPDAGALKPWLSFRLVFLSREGDDLVETELFRAKPRRLADIVAR